MGCVNDFDVSDVTVTPAAEGFLKGAAKWGLRKVATNVIAQVLLAIPKMEYKRISAENDRQRAYGNFIKIMDAAAKQRRGACTPDELSDTCPMALTIAQYYQEGRTTDGTAPLRMYTIIGDDGEVINIQGFDLMQTIKITVMHKNGRVLSENLSPQDAMKTLKWLAGLAPSPD
jgi:hypothetical protein